MAGQSLFKACKIINITRASGTAEVGGYDIGFELYNQASIDANVAAIAAGTATKCTFGDADESKIVLVADSTITVPTGFNLTPANPKKSLVIMCNTFINNGTVSMTAKGPNVLPHDYFILANDDLIFDEISDIIIPAYANNAVTVNYTTTTRNGADGKAGTNRQCGSGGTGSHAGFYAGWPSERPGTAWAYTAKSGSGSAFAGGAGCATSNGGQGNFSANTTYPMRGVDSKGSGPGGVGNPAGANVNTSGLTYAAQNKGVGGRVIIFCKEFINNGTISANGVNSVCSVSRSDPRNMANSGGASGGGAVDIFYTTLTTQGTITANGGAGVNGYPPNFITKRKSGNGGVGSVTLMEWHVKNLVKPPQKYFTSDNWLYLFDHFEERLRGVL